MLACNHGVTTLESWLSWDTLCIAVSLVSAVVLDVDSCVGETQSIGPLSQEMTTPDLDLLAIIGWIVGMVRFNKWLSDDKNVGAALLAAS